VPAAAVIPAPVAYIKVVAVKKLVVGFLADRRDPLSYGSVCYVVSVILADSGVYHSFGLTFVICIDYFEKIRVFKAGLCLEYISME
jgi:hypothetical protein